MSAGVATTSTGSTVALRPYQAAAVNAAVAGLSEGGRGQVYAACGSGKTIVAIRAAEKLCPAGGIVGVLCPSLALVAQTLESWQRSAERGFAALVVAGDKTVADSPVDVTDLPCPVTTDPEAIHSWLHTSQADIRLVISTHISADRLGEALLAARLSAAVIVIDEAHHTAGLRDKHTSLIHDDRRLPADRRLYMTATPRLLADGRDIDDAAILAMDESDVFGPVLSNYPFAQAIEEGWLDDYRLVVIGVARRDVLAALREIDPESVGDAFSPSLRMAAVQVALAQAAAEWNLRRVIAFCPRIADAALFARTLPRAVAAAPQQPAGPLHSGLVTGLQTFRQRNIELGRLADPPAEGWTVLSNARVLAEGVDVPAVDGVVFTRPKRSTVEIVQAVGRALRPHPDGRQTATVLVPILLPDDPHELTDVDDAAEYETLWQVVRALRAHDEVLAAELDRNRAKFGGSGGYSTQLPQRLVVRLPAEFEGDRWLQHLSVRIVRSATSAWWEGFGAAEGFQQEHGHLDAPAGYVTESGFRLGDWIVTQRFLHRRLMLRRDRVTELERLGITWDPRQAQWEAMVAAATDFFAENGHLGVRQEKSKSGLGGWLVDRRREYRAGTLAADRVAQLVAVDPLWHDGGLSRGLAAARLFHAAHGHLQVPARHRELDLDLSHWVATQRRTRRGKHLEPHIEEVLTGLGFQWTTAADRGAELLDAARRFHREHGHLDTSSAAGHDAAELSGWLSSQRALYRRGELDPARTAALTELGIDWSSPGERSWDTGLVAASSFAARTGGLKVPPDHRENGVDLASWVERQRAARRQGRLSDEQVETLTALGIDWEPRPGPGRGLAAARTYLADQGDLWVPPGYRTADGFPLGQWVRTQRQLRRMDALAEELVRQLDDLGMIWEPAAARTAQGLAAARDFYRDNGHLRVSPTYRTPEGFALGNWIRKRRDDRRIGRLTGSLETELDALDMVWDPAVKR